MWPPKPIPIHVEGIGVWPHEPLPHLGQFVQVTSAVEFTYAAAMLFHKTALHSTPHPPGSYIFSHHPPSLVMCPDFGGWV